MRNVRSIVRISVFPLAGLSLVACAPFFENEFAWQPSPGAHVVQTNLKQMIGYYENAVTAINSRRYALALEYLQAARAQRPDDVRVLTAFGVVYDKLGRFDLSARYYAQASTLEPKSPVIAADLDYSRRLQGLSTGGLAPQVADAGSSPAEPSQPQTALASVEAPPPSFSVAAVDIGQGFMPGTVGSASSNASVKPKVDVAPALAAKIVVAANIGEGSAPRTVAPATGNVSATPKVAVVPPPAAKAVAATNTGQGSTPRTVVPAASNASAKPKATVAYAPAAKEVVAANIGQGSTPRTVAPAASNASAKPKAAVAYAPAAKEVVAANIGQGSMPRTVIPATSNVSAKVKAAAVPAAKTVVLTGHPLAIVDASGRGDTDKSVRSYLSGRGWSVAKDASAKRPVQAQTVILYKETMITAAKALARTLSLPMRLTVSNDILGLQLVLGGDISGTNIAKKSLAPQHRQVALAAANTGKRE